MDLSELERTYGRRFVEDLLDLQRTIKRRGLEGVGFMEAAHDWAEARADDEIADAIDDHLRKL
jgi:hypothetical protein